MTNSPNDWRGNGNESERLQQALNAIADREDHARTLAENTDNPAFAAGIRILLDLANDKEPNPADVHMAAGNDEGGDSKNLARSVELSLDRVTSEEGG